MRADIDGTILEIGATWPRLLGWSEAELINKSFYDFVHPEDVASTREALGRVARATTASTFCNGFRRHDGTYGWYSWTAIAKDGYLCAVAQDASSEKAAADALGRQQDTLYQWQKTEVTGLLARGVAHEFNNAFQNIVASLELVRKLVAAGRGGEIERFIVSATSSAQRAAALTQRWFDFSRSAPPAPRRVAINQLISGLAEMLRRVLPSMVTVEVDPAPDLWDVHCDENELERALLNLVLHARDAMPGGGSMIIRTRNADMDAGAARALGISSGPCVRIDVVEPGAGMDEATAFDAPSTVHADGQRLELGLTMVRQFARRNGGEATIASAAGAGTTVTIVLPRHPEAGAQSL